MLKGIEDGLYNPSMKERMAALEAGKALLQTRLEQVGIAPTIRVHPNLPAIYQTKVARLAEVLNAPDVQAEAQEIIRSLIERIVLTPDGEHLRAELYGDLAGILAFCEGAKREPGGSEGIVSVVAGARNLLVLLFQSHDITAYLRR